MESRPRYNRVLLKLSGEAFAGEQGYGIEPETIQKIALELASIQATGAQIAIVVGGGNILRGSVGEKQGMDRAQADYMGMLATVINAMALQDALEKCSVDTRVQTADKGLRHLEKGRVVILAGGTGNPYFTTDTASALRAVELEADVVLMAKNGTDAVYDKDPRKFDDAKPYTNLTFEEALDKKLRVMDLTAFTHCMEHNLPIIVFDMNVAGNIQRAVVGEPIGTLVERSSS